MAHGDIATQRREMQQLEDIGVEALGPISPLIEEFWTDISLPNGWTSRAKVVRPKAVDHLPAPGSSTKKPLIVFFYGGGFAAGTPNMVTRPARDFAAELGAVVVCPSYRLVPDVTWPVPTQDGWEVVRYFADHSDQPEATFGANLDDGFVVGGVSAGGIVASVVAAAAAFGDGEDRTLKKPLTGCFMNCPTLMVDQNLPAEYHAKWTSRVDNKDSPDINTEGVNRMIHGLQCDDYNSVWFSPVARVYTALKSGGMADRLPPSYFQVSYHDPARDDGIIYEDILRRGGVKTRFDLFPDDVHDAWVALPFSGKSKDPEIGKATMEGMAWLLGSK